MTLEGQWCLGTVSSSKSHRKEKCVFLSSWKRCFNCSFFLLLFLVQPKITYLNNQTASEFDKQVTLTCEASGDPTPTISWSFENRVLTEGEQVLLLCIYFQQRCELFKHAWDFYDPDHHDVESYSCRPAGSFNSRLTFIQEMSKIWGFSSCRTPI